jgi:hypothetical protein
VSETPLHELRTSRLVPAPVERALNAALTRGPGYEPLPLGTAFDGRTVSGYYLDFRAKTTSPATSDPARLLPAAHVQLALGWWERHVAGEDGALERFLDLCAGVERRGEPAGGELRWPIGAAVPKYRLAPGWCSALVQGQAASMFARARLATGEARFGELAAAAAEPLLADGGSDLVTRTGSGPILEEAPSEPPSHVLNGWVFALWGLWDLGTGLDHGRARAAFDDGVRCLRAHLPAYDTGRWTLYSLYPHALPDLAKPFYHRLHADQMTALARLGGGSELDEAARRWASYDRPANVALAVAQKAAFALADGRRRRRWRGRQTADSSLRSKR